MPVVANERPVSIEEDDEAGFCAFYRSSRDALARALAVTLSDPDTAADAVDEAMVRAFQRWSEVSAMPNREGWVYRVAFNWAASGLRRRRRVPVAVRGPEPSGIGPVDEPAVARALAELEVRQRAVVVCRYLLGGRWRRPLPRCGRPRARSRAGCIGRPGSWPPGCRISAPRRRNDRSGPTGRP